MVRLIPEQVEPELVPVASLRTHPENPRRGDVEALGRSVAAHGVFRTIVVSSDDVILAGNHTYLGAREQGETMLWVSRVPFPHTDEQARQIMLVDNRTADLGQNDEALLLEALNALEDTAAAGYDDADVAELLRGLDDDPAGSVPEPEEVPSVPESKRGDLYSLGEHRLLCGDATVAADLERLMDGHLANLVFTDPPYGVEYEGGQGNKRKRDRLANDDIDLYAAATRAAHAHSTDDAALYLFFAGSLGARAYVAAESAGYDVRALMIWRKVNPHYGAWMAQYMPQMEPFLYAHKDGRAPAWYGATNEVNVWDVEQPARNDHHPTQKPVELAERAIKNSSRPREIVLDMFGGSGSTLIAAERTGRRAFVMELDPGYCDVIVARWESLTGAKAEHER